MRPRVAVIGAGWAGLAAALELAERADVCLFEAGRAPGGRARRLGHGDSRLDNGQHILIGAYAECLRLMRKAGADPERLLLRQPMQWRREGGLSMRCPALPAPLHLLFGLLAARGLSWRAKWQLARALQHLKRAGYRLAEDCSVDAWLEAQRQGEEARREFWRPLVLSALNTPTANASMRVLAAVLRDSLGAERAASDLLLPRVDLSALFPEPACDWLGRRGATLRFGRRVETLASRDGRAWVDGEAFDAAILATAPYHAAALLDDAALRKQAAGYRYWPICTVYLQYAKPLALPAAMCAVSGGAADWLFDRGALTGETGLLAAVLSAPAPERLADVDALAARVAADVARLRPDLPPPLSRRAIVERRATFASEQGLARPTAKTSLQCVYLAGDWVCPDYPATLEGAVRSGVSAAAAVMQDLRIEQ